MASATNHDVNLTTNLHEKEYIAYLCNECKLMQKIKFNAYKKEDFKFADSVNGLSLWSHSHVCKTGMTGTNNLYIDHNLDVRSYNYVELPKYEAKKAKMAIPGMAMPSVRKKVHLSHILKYNDLKMKLSNDMFDYDVTVGNEDFSKETPVKTLKSSMGMVSIEFYESNTRYTETFYKWMQFFTDNMELLLPSKLGPIVEVLKFMLSERGNLPTGFDDSIMKTILASHDIFFEIKNEDIGFLENTYGESKIMKKIVEVVKDNHMITVHAIVDHLKEDITTVIYLILLLENHGILEIHRPAIMAGF